jgi:very-short-patch-repair endonuclease
MQENICSICQKVCKTAKGLKSHIWKCHTEAGVAQKPFKGKTQIPWNKGLSKDSDARVAKISEKISIGQKGRTLTTAHRLKLSLIQKGKIGRPHTIKTKDKLSKMMKERHRAGLAHNIGSSRWNHQPSWPEKWFMTVISNEFIDKNYLREYPFHRFSLDFVWLHKKRVIEIDGEQHERFLEQKARDRVKDALLSQEGYAILRVRWKDICNDAKGSIQRMKDFIDFDPGRAQGGPADC